MRVFWSARRRVFISCCSPPVGRLFLLCSYDRVSAWASFSVCFCDRLFHGICFGRIIELCPINWSWRCSTTSDSWTASGNSALENWANAREKVDSDGNCEEESQPHNRRQLEFVFKLSMSNFVVGRLYSAFSKKARNIFSRLCILRPTPHQFISLDMKREGRTISKIRIKWTSFPEISPIFSAKLLKKVTFDANVMA